jgi:hypothetical protein
MESYLDSKCWKKPEGYCKDQDCSHAVKQAPNGRWFITMGHAGFNTKANNGIGYVSLNSARNVIKRLLSR